MQFGIFTASGQCDGFLCSLTVVLACICLSNSIFRAQSRSVHTGHGLRGDCEEADSQAEGAVVEMCRLGVDRTMQCDSYNC